jgi:hypothetical protein
MTGCDARVKRRLVHVRWTAGACPIRRRAPPRRDTRHKFGACADIGDEPGIEGCRERNRSLHWRPALLPILTASALLGAVPALADATLPSTTPGTDIAHSNNWAGYVAHGAGARFRTVVARWTQPKAECARGHESSAAIWIGLGGYRRGAHVIDQIGTELDCSAAGRATSSAWYELTPAPSHTLALQVAPGDRVAAVVSARRRSVSFSLVDLTSHRRFRQTFAVRAADRSSAEWIVEAPSLCNSPGDCTELPLADFGRTDFRHARVWSTRGRAGSIGTPAWTSTQLQMTPPVATGAGAPSASTRDRHPARVGTMAPAVRQPPPGRALTSTPTSGGSAFSVRYAPWAPPA